MMKLILEWAEEAEYAVSNILGSLNFVGIRFSR